MQVTPVPGPSKKRKYEEDENYNDNKTSAATVSSDHLKSVKEAVIWFQHLAETLDSKRCEVSFLRIENDIK